MSAAIAKIGVLVALMSVAACSATSEGEPAADKTAESSTPSAMETPGGFAPVGPGVPIEAGRQFVFATTQSGGRMMLTVGADGVLTVTDHLEDQALFVTTPVKAGGDEYLMQTAKMLEGGEPWCLAVHSPGGTQPRELKTAACDTGKQDQIFTFPKTSDGKGIVIEVDGRYLLTQDKGEKVVVQESGKTSFTVRDQGKSTLPRLGD
ncbi:hypothetical protein [Actinoplanes awajinensis]|uniref:Ricin B lectin domain-containing protein n=1 Tax=Actinoplanes awajinensis subsp. mycoplanecinus TaxID=135947 RepID=A0A101JLP3_9ACTN|nr:hypothetical protein [Actinoplanes awajinensis]KUL28686.1 hypothetical protein ADL15_31440 [Actinoplanes awajinensis subsp. mycoplanecinus]